MGPLLDDGGVDVGELGQLRGGDHAGGAGADDEDVDLVSELGGAVDAHAGGGGDPGIGRDVSVVVELHLSSLTGAG